MSKNRKRSGRSHGRNTHTETRKQQGRPAEIHLADYDAPDQIPVTPEIQDPASELAEASHRVTFEKPVRESEAPAETPEETPAPDALPLTEETAAPEVPAEAETPAETEGVPAQPETVSAEVEEAPAEIPVEQAEAAEAPAEPAEEPATAAAGPEGESEDAGPEAAGLEKTTEGEAAPEEASEETSSEETPSEGTLPEAPKTATVTVSPETEAAEAAKEEEKDLPGWKKYLISVVNYWNFRGRGGSGKDRNPAARGLDPNLMSMAVSLCILILILILSLQFIRLYRSGSLENDSQAMAGEDTARVTEIGGVPLDEISFRTKFTAAGHVFAILDMRDFDLETMMETEGISQYDCLEKIARALDGHLAVIHDAEENQAIYEAVAYYSQKTVFLGGTDQDSEGEWRWVTGEDFTYTNWSEGQPNNGANNEDGSDENYLQFSSITKDGTWNDSPIFGNTYFFLVEWE